MAEQSGIKRAPAQYHHHAGPIVAAPTLKSEPMDHEYDGIQEFDNPTPGWWHAIFIGTVLFSVAYIGFWHMSPLGTTPEQQWAARASEEGKKLFAMGDLKPDDATIVKLMGNSDLMNMAKGLFVTNCAACHTKDGGGLPGMGVNLTDDVYKNTTTLHGLYDVITAGANNGAMPAWKNNFSDKERILLAAYVANLRGKNVPGGQPPAGQAIAPWPTAATATAASEAAPTTVTPTAGK